MIPVHEPLIGEEELNNVIEAIRSGWISSKGHFIQEFEKKFAEYIGVKYGIATSNGTTALHLALMALGIKNHDEVIIPTLTFIATANVVRYCNATPVFVDSHPNYWCMNPEQIESKITEKTKAIIVVHLYGHPCDMDWIKDIAEEYDLYLIEDAAEAHGSEYKGKKVGSFGDISCFSFYGNKLITTGEGGMCLTNDEELAERMRILRDHGMDPKKKYWHNVIGFNYRMTNIQAAIGVAQLKKIEEFIKKKRKIASWYYNALQEVAEKGIITLHPEMPWARSIFWLYSIIINDSSNINRDTIMRVLYNKGIETRPFFYPIHIQPPYKNYAHGNFPIAEYLSKGGLNLPSSVKLTKNEVEYIASVLSELLVNSRR